MYGGFGNLGAPVLTAQARPSGAPSLKGRSSAYQRPPSLAQPTYAHILQRGANEGLIGWGGRVVVGTPMFFTVKALNAADAPRSVAMLAWVGWGALAAYAVYRGGKYATRKVRKRR